MGNEAKLWKKSKVSKFALVEFGAMDWADGCGMVSPAMHASVSVPFGWEEKPGKAKEPRLCFNNSATQTKCLQLPPRLLLIPPPITPQKGFFHLPTNHCCCSFSFHKNQLGAMVLRKRPVFTHKDWFSWLRKTSFWTKTEVKSAFGTVFSSLDKKNESKGAIASETLSFG